MPLLCVNFRRKWIPLVQLPLIVEQLDSLWGCLPGGSRWHTPSIPNLFRVKDQDPGPFLLLWGETRDSRWSQCFPLLVMTRLDLAKRFKSATLFNNLFVFRGPQGLPLCEPKAHVTLGYSVHMKEAENNIQRWKSTHLACARVNVL